MMKTGIYNKGFTLLELLITLVVLSTLLVLAVPSFSTMMQRNRLKTATNEWRSSYYYAQNLAMTTKSVINFCASSDGKSCNAQDFQVGWIICRSCGRSDDKKNTYVYMDFPPSSANNEVSMVITAGNNRPSARVEFLKNGDVAGAMGQRMSASIVNNPAISSVIQISSGGRLTTNFNR